MHSIDGVFYCNIIIVMQTLKIVVNSLFLFLQIESTLRNMYSYLQKLAVGLEQVALDQIIYGGVYDEEFNLAEYRLKGVSINSK